MYLNPPLVQHQDLVVVDDGVQSVGDGEKGLALQLMEQSFLEMIVKK